MPLPLQSNALLLNAKSMPKSSFFLFYSLHSVLAARSGVSSALYVFILCLHNQLTHLVSVSGSSHPLNGTSLLILLPPPSAPKCPHLFSIYSPSSFYTTTLSPSHWSSRWKSLNTNKHTSSILIWTCTTPKRIRLPCAEQVVWWKNWVRLNMFSVTRYGDSP